MTFKRICHISLQHEFLNWEIAHPISILPSPQTKEILNNYGFLIQGAKGTLSLLSNRTPFNELLDYLTQITGVDTFEFELIPEFSSVYAYTHMADDPNETFLYSTSNSRLNKANGKELIASKTASSNKAAIGRIELTFDSLKNDFSNYSIKLYSRKTAWEYYIINSRSIDLSHAIIEGKAGINFRKVDERILANGQKATPFLMEDEFIPLKKRPASNFNLVQKKNNQKKMIYKGLPIADPSNLKFTQMNGKKVYQSPIYVYI